MSRFEWREKNVKKQSQKILYGNFQEVKYFDEGVMRKKKQGKDGDVGEMEIV